MLRVSENPAVGPKLGLLVLVCISLMPAVAGAWPWSRDMANQISIKPQEGPDAIRPFPARSVPMPGTNMLFYVHDRDGAMKLVNPNPATEESLHHGRKFFQIFCTPCHGKSGTGDGLVGAKFLIRPFDLTADNEQKVLSEGYIFGTVAFGGALMPSYGNDLSPSEIWDVVNYVRHGLVSDNRQLAGAGSVSDSPGGKSK
jgi:S-disulfanyl-L-cysteine oxidoreductase SoxD